ncbi:MAG: FAD-dependent oxidoreductase [Acidobacteria bacterium]|nr:FAD-dependent oxidoreductase [Acidobacteriota bacterium]
MRGAAIYYDAQVEFAERLVVENVLSAKEHGATVITYARVQKLTGQFTDAGRVVEFIDTRTGAAFAACGRIIVNAAGPWVDEVLTSIERPSKRLIGGTKGSHIIVNSFAGAPSTALYVEAESDKRPFFIIPWDDKYLIGTTDIRFTGDVCVHCLTQKTKTRKKSLVGTSFESQGIRKGSSPSSAASSLPIATLQSRQLI